MEVKYQDIQLYPVFNTVRREDMSDETYFSEPFSKGYISNSKLGNLKKDGKAGYLNGFKKDYFESFFIGTVIHSQLLTPEEFTFQHYSEKPSAKLGAVMDKTLKLAKGGTITRDHIKMACKDVNYYSENITEKRIDSILEKGKDYLALTDYDDSVFRLNDNQFNIVENALKSCKRNSQINKLINPVDTFGDPIESHCEDALFMDFVGIYDGKCVRLPLKQKIDNWTIDVENKTLTLNDVKTTSEKYILGFKTEEGHFHSYSYYRQFYFYSQLLKEYCKIKYGYDDKTWTFNSNVIVIQTVDPFYTKVFPVTEEDYCLGKYDFEQLLKQVAYYEINGWDKDVTFVCE
jgi:hypothetical protein